jgi:hypothetical protein
MFLILTASADTYITNKIIKNERKTNSNVGLASTLDLFKLYDESYSSIETNPIELSRILIKFDLSPLRNTSNTNFIADSSFRARLELFDVLGGNTSPNNFNVEVFPLSQSFIEGTGRNVQQFLDNDICNFLSASVSPWFLSGSNQKGNLNSSNIDVIVSGNLNDGLGTRFLGTSQSFSGPENLSLDITKVISGTIANQIPDCGFRISFTETEENDIQTRFVKRFSSRHSSNPLIRPRILISFNDSLRDDTESFFFDSSGSIFLNSFVRNQKSNLVSGSSLVPITGNNCVLLKLSTGSYEKFITGSQFSIGNNFVNGLYKANFSILSSDNTLVSPSSSLQNLIYESGSITFEKSWLSLDKSILFFKDFLTVKKNEINSFLTSPKELQFSIINCNKRYKRDEKFKFKVFVRDLNEFKFASKIPLRLKSIPISNVYYKIIDLATKKEIIPYLLENNGTLLSQDSEGLYFDLFFNNLPIGRQLGFYLKSNDYGNEREYFMEDVSFMVE